MPSGEGEAAGENCVCVYVLIASSLFSESALKAGFQSSSTLVNAYVMNQGQENMRI